jgi:MarR family transcriptional regulator for hemolysin
VLKHDFEESVGYWICSTSHVLRRALDTELARENITFRQWEVLAWIAMCGELSQVELAERLGIEAPTLAGILSRMERDGWLERTCCSKDRRRKLINATEKAEEVWERALDCCRRVRQRAVTGITENELGQLKSICERMRENLETPVEILAESNVVV